MANDGILTTKTYTGQDIYTDDHPPIIMTGPIGAASGTLAPGYLLKKANNILVPIERTQTGEDAVAATGSITCVAVASLVDAETVSISDGELEVVFEFDVTGDGVAGDNTAVDVSEVATDVEVATALQAAIVASDLDITVTRDDAVLTLTNNVAGEAGNVAITETVVNAGFIVDGMADGDDGVPYTDVALTPSQVVGVCLETADGTEDSSVRYLMHGTVVSSSVSLAGDALIAGERELLAQVGIHLL
jgi:hypothetical protein